ncbi:hypothetical protein DZC30_14225 [Comamonas testosteroni]|uniref:4'-phosphopantetheinyl transferase domain-containing protein n=1 Tax=Comamonas testosteroni TaxID=285 RepID=A0A373FJR0_COMTE|nr:4'-phosphopantetheinyl transferase superfamily protein [Comamonas testosteroni]RGE43762.1 hypothetical protein DZC30_14225 [Comamonas testosteroni]
MKTQRCSFEGWQAPDAPRVHLLQGVDASDRERARLQAREALKQLLAQELGCAEADLQISNIRAQAPEVWRGVQLLALHCSISHAPGHALLAWSQGGAVGVDIQAVQTGAAREELEDVAQLYLGPNKAVVLKEYTQNAHFFEAFAQAWTLNEARLKCAGTGLVEWSEALTVQLQELCSAELQLPAAMSEYRAAIAWSY